MKQTIILILSCILLAGCAGYPIAPANLASTPAQAQTESPTQSTAESNIKPEATQGRPEALLTYTLYLPNENADGFVTRTVQTPSITAESVLAELQKGGALPADGIIINAFGAEDDQLHIDFNAAFADAVNAMGTSGEYMIIGSLVNTYLNAFQAQSLFLTVEGEILESGHVIYDFPLTFHE